MYRILLEELWPRTKGDPFETIAIIGSKLKRIRLEYLFERTQTKQIIQFRLPFSPTIIHLKSTLTITPSGDSTIFFDVAMTRLKKKSILERSVTAVQFFLFPLSTTLIIFYLWQKMNESEEPLQQSSKLYFVDIIK